jgi:hypothetical protein
MGRVKIRPIVGIFHRDFTIIGLGWSTVNKAFILTILSLYIGIEFKRKFNRK